MASNAAPIQASDAAAARRPEPASPQDQEKSRVSNQIETEEHAIGGGGDDDDVSKKDHAHYEKIDKEVAKYAGAEAVYISPEESSRLRKMIDKRVLVIMITTYFLQAIDKGTLSFAYVVSLGW
jgi:hypothetical protein